MSMPAELKAKDLVGIPWRVALALQADGWYLRQDIIWHKPNPMPESVTDRCTKAHEYVFLMAKSQRYYYDAEAISEMSLYPDDNRKARQNPEDYEKQMGEVAQIRAVINPSGAKVYPTRNRRSVWTVCTKPYSGAHFAVMPPDLVKPCILAGCPEGGVVLDPFMGSGTVAAVAQDAGRRAIGIELNPEYCKLIAKRFRQRRFI
jgi:site-specific DNA-methyltransferase (adenine-specific)